MRFALLLFVAGLAAAQALRSPAASTTRVVTINRDEYEYKQGTPCPITYVEPDNPRQALRQRISEGFKICKKGNIANCPQGAVFYMDERLLGKCQKCLCDMKSGGLYTASCNKIDCKDLPKSTPIPGKGVLVRDTRQACRRTEDKVCSKECTYMARDRRCVYCDCGGKVDFNLEKFKV